MTSDQLYGLVLQRWLEAHKVRDFCSSPSGWITDFVVEETPHRYDNSSLNSFMTSFSVLPAPLSGDDWQAGNGIADPDSRWIRHKTIFFTVEKIEGRYFMGSQATSPM
jgi:hypothetical protein